MQLSIKHTQSRGPFGPSFLLWARIELDENEAQLIYNYLMYDAVLIEGDNERAQRVGARFALPIAIIVTIIAAILGGPSIPYNAIGWTSPYYTFPIIFGCLAYLLTLYIIYNSMRETTYVKDILKGRAFRARSLIVLLEKEDQLQKVVVAFRHLLELMKTWNETRVITIRPGEEPQLRLIEPPHAAA